MNKPCGKRLYYHYDEGWCIDHGTVVLPEERSIISFDVFHAMMKQRTYK